MDLQVKLSINHYRLSIATVFVKIMPGRHLKVSFADMKAPWMSTDSLPTQGQRDYLEKKGAYAEAMTRGQASIEIRKIIASKNKQKRSMASEPITDKQRYFLKNCGIETANMSKFQAMKEIAKIKAKS